MLAACPACGSFNLVSNDLSFDDADSYLAQSAGERIHVECTRCHWMGSGKAQVTDNRLVLTNLGHSDHVFW